MMPVGDVDKVDGVFHRKRRAAERRDLLERCLQSGLCVPTRGSGFDENCEIRIWIFRGFQIRNWIWIWILYVLPYNLII